MNETGMAQRAAIVRVSNNGRQFAENALKAALHGRRGIEALQAEPYSTGGPSLSRMFLALIPEEHRARLAGQRKVRFSEVAMIGAWIFNRAAILGMLVAEKPHAFVAMIWDPDKLDEYESYIKRELRAIDSLEEQPKSLGYLRMTTGYAELFGKEATSKMLASGNFKESNRLAASMIAWGVAEERWLVDAAVGLGVGIQRPDLVLTCLESEANPDLGNWKEAHDAGLDIPEVPDIMRVDEQIEAVVESCLALFGEYYPEARDTLMKLTKSRSDVT